VKRCRRRVAHRDARQGLEARRLDRLSGETRDTLAAASVLGADIEVALVSALTGRTRGAVLTALTEAESAGLVTRTAGGGFGVEVRGFGFACRVCNGPVTLKFVPGQARQNPSLALFALVTAAISLVAYLPRSPW